MRPAGRSGAALPAVVGISGSQQPSRASLPHAYAWVADKCLNTASLSSCLNGVGPVRTLMLGQSTPSTTSPPPTLPVRAAVKPQRALACVLCQQRKVKCDRQSPCANCLRVRVPCETAKLAPRQRRRRRFPERDLLERLHRYEGLLREKGIAFEPLHSSPGEKASPSADGSGDDSQGDENLDASRSAPKRVAKSRGHVKSETVYEAKSVSL